MKQQILKLEDCYSNAFGLLAALPTSSLLSIPSHSVLLKAEIAFSPLPSPRQPARLEIPTRSPRPYAMLQHSSVIPEVAALLYLSRHFTKSKVLYLIGLFSLIYHDYCIFISFLKVIINISRFTYGSSSLYGYPGRITPMVILIPS